ncbi:hypothetical protein ACA910_004137 [Epithemia clementina (nom. ined.)]
MNREVVQHQERARALLKARGFEFTEIDGSDPGNKDRQNYLFEVSGMVGEYPQFFLVEQTEDTVFLGDWSEIEAINDASSLPKDFRDANPELGTWERVLQEGDELLVLVSSIALHRGTLQQQERAITLLKAQKIPFTSMDGADPANKVRRCELVEISGVAKYPQFFINRKGSKTTFLGTWESVEAINDASRLPRDILRANPSIDTWEKVLG